MIVQPDDLVKQILVSTLAALKADPSPLNIIFQQKAPSELAAIVEFFGANNISVRFGYPRESAELPGLYVTIGSGSEQAQVIGSDWPLDDDIPPGDPSPAPDISNITGTWLDVNVVIGCMAIHAGIPQWLSSVAMWAILGNRLALNASGFIEQRLGLKDLAPEERLRPSYVFRRDLSVAGRVPATAEDYTQYAIVNKIIVIPTFKVPSFGPITINQFSGISGIGDD